MSAPLTALKHLQWCNLIVSFFLSVSLKLWNLRQIVFGFSSGCVSGRNGQGIACVCMLQETWVNQVPAV